MAGPLKQQLELSRLKLLDIIGAHPTVAIDPGYMNTGYSSLIADPGGWFNITCVLECPYRFCQTGLLDETPNHHLPAKPPVKLPLLSAAIVGGYYARCVADYRGNPHTKILIETQPPQMAGGGPTRAFTQGFHAGLTSLKYTDIERRSVRDYKAQRLGIGVYSKRAMNKNVSMLVMDKLIEFFPLSLQFWYKRNADCADSFLLLLSEVVTLLRRDKELCSLLPTHSNCEPLSLVQLFFLLVELPQYNEKELQEMWNSLQQNELAMCLRPLCHASCAKRTRVSHREGKTKSTTPGVQHATSTQEENGTSPRILMPKLECLSFPKKLTGEPVEAVAEKAPEH